MTIEIPSGSGVVGNSASYLNHGADASTATAIGGAGTSSVVNQSA